MIIFGWGYQTTKIFGPTFEHACPNCNNKEHWILNRVMTWFTLFFIPIFPYSIEYFLGCPVCQHGLTLDGKQIKEIKPVAELNQLLIDGKVSELEYKSQINKLEANNSSQTETGILKDSVDKLIYCSACGKSIIKEIKFCGNCGTKVDSK